MEELKKYFPGELSKELNNNIECFLFSEYPSSIRKNEIKLSRKYLKQATVFVYFYDNKIVATWRNISKFNTKLPIEYAKIKESDKLNKNEFFCVNFLPNVYNTGEIANLRISNLIDYRLSYKILNLVLETCEDDCFSKKFDSVFITCENNIQFKRLYEKKFGFKEFAKVTYDDNKIWLAMIRNLNPLKLERYNP